MLRKTIQFLKSSEEKLSGEANRSGLERPARRISPFPSPPPPPPRSITPLFSSASTSWWLEIRTCNFWALNTSSIQENGMLDQGCSLAERKHSFSWEIFPNLDTNGLGPSVCSEKVDNGPQHWCGPQTVVPQSFFLDRISCSLKLYKTFLKSEKLLLHIEI